MWILLSFILPQKKLIVSASTVLHLSNASGQKWKLKRSAVEINQRETTCWQVPSLSCFLLILRQPLLSFYARNPLKAPLLLQLRSKWPRAFSKLQTDSFSLYDPQGCLKPVNCSTMWCPQQQIVLVPPLVFPYKVDFNAAICWSFFCCYDWNFKKKKNEKLTKGKLLKKVFILAYSATEDMNHHGREGMAAEVWGPVGKQEVDWSHWVCKQGPGFQVPSPSLRMHCLQSTVFLLLSKQRHQLETKHWTAWIIFKP